MCGNGRPPSVILQGALAALGMIVGLVREPRTQTSQHVTTSKREEKEEREVRGQVDDVGAAFYHGRLNKNGGPNHKDGL